MGSRNEAIGYTGATHLLEHMMFKGSRRFNKAENSSIWTMMQANGASINATTSFDRTTYYMLSPVEAAGLALEIEADRMRGALLRQEDFESEMTVVRNEFERGANSELSELSKQLWATAYQATYAMCDPHHISSLSVMQC